MLGKIYEYVSYNVLLEYITKGRKYCLIPILMSKIVIATTTCKLGTYISFLNNCIEDL